MSESLNRQPSLSEKVAEITGISVNKCYQCGKCSAGCPVANDMDYSPSLIMRMLQTDDPQEEEKILRSYSIWLCLSCEMCYCRCPMSIDIPSIMDALRQKAYSEKKVNPKAKKIIAFHESFLDSIKWTGRLYEIGLVATYKLKTLDLLKDVELAPKMYLKGKLNILPEKMHGLKNVSGLFKKSK
ncbi:MAG: 4Fe-4S dicluster domain-containing protein [Bacteroidota bacterium]|nr:4Fe-4S dicluster domain-containing protein [Bacteroidota bacterium]MDP4205894.1 4Fe-4S dicluster domain-containing protein [Bacteroidota bacterium]